MQTLRNPHQSVAFLHLTPPPLVTPDRHQGRQARKSRLCPPLNEFISAPLVARASPCLSAEIFPTSPEGSGGERLHLSGSSRWRRGARRSIARGSAQQLRAASVARTLSGSEQEAEGTGVAKDKEKEGD